MQKVLDMVREALEQLSHLLRGPQPQPARVPVRVPAARRPQG